MEWRKLTKNKTLDNPHIKNVILKCRRHCLSNFWTAHETFFEFSYGFVTLANLSILEHCVETS